ncbi:MAG: nicotinate phosphoribosyltransferase [Deltaproteobacteria bacterium]|nr:MAG: nicotinate phosphoribosyltransferase [Deltaproteobacteria bacterium]
MECIPECRHELVIDLYQLTMAASYFEQKMSAPATFSLFIRAYPPNRNFFIAAGLEELLVFLENFRYQKGDLEYLDTLGLFKPDFLDFLGSLKFTGQVRAMPEGTIFFKDEPILEVTAPIIEAQLVETLVINMINVSTMIATKAARCVNAAQGRRLVDFALRRTQGIDAGLKVARSSYLAGFIGTSNVLAGKIYNIPVFGTMAHSYITSFPSEIEAFRAFAKAFPRNAVLLIDTFDPIAGTRHAIKVARELEEQGYQLRGVRLDSGDLVDLSIRVRKLLDENGLKDVQIFASGGFDEFKIDDVLSRGAKIDAFGVGTKMGVSADAPYFDMAYKLVQYDGRPVMKLSTGKVTYVGAKQVFRFFDDDGFIDHDTIGLKSENHPPAHTLLQTFMVSGKRVRDPENLETIKMRVEKEFMKLPPQCKTLDAEKKVRVEISEELEKLQQEVKQQIIEKELGEG